MSLSLCLPTVHSPVPTASQQTNQSEQELVEVKGRLRTAEEQKSELAEQLKIANASVEQYRAVVLTLEDSLKKEKEVRLFDLFDMLSNLLTPSVSCHTLYCLYYSYTLLHTHIPFFSLVHLWRSD